MDDAFTLRAKALSLSLQHSDAVLMWKQLIQEEPDSPDHWTGLRGHSSKPATLKRRKNATQRRPP